MVAQNASRANSRRGCVIVAPAVYSVCSAVEEMFLYFLCFFLAQFTG